MSDIKFENKTYPNGDKYIGYLKDGKFHNKGVYRCSNGLIYEGRFEDGNYTDGKMTYPNGDIYIGHWENNMPHGKGELKFTDGSYYDGDWKSGSYHGCGVFKTNVYKYVGKFRNGLKHGLGQLTYSNGDVYTGYWIDDEIYNVQVTYANGHVYSGELENNKRNGFGYYDCKNGYAYLGCWEDGKREVYGKEKCDGYTYVGQFYNDLKYGIGRYSNNDETFFGCFRNGKKNGFGVSLKKPTGIQYGIWEDDKYLGVCGVECSKTTTGNIILYAAIDDNHGFCFSMSPDDNMRFGQANPHGFEGLIINQYKDICYHSCVVNEKYHGVTMVEKENMMAIVTYENGFAKGYGVMYYPDNSRYIGEYQDFKKHGNGILLLPNGELQEGYFYNDHMSRTRIQCVKDEIINFDELF